MILVFMKIISFKYLNIKLTLMFITLLKENLNYDIT